MRGNYIKTLGIAVLCFSFVALVPRASAQRVELLNLTNTVWSYSQENVDYLSSVPAFYETTFDASTWPTGQGLFGLEASGGTVYTDADGNPAPGEINSGGGGTQFNTAWTRNPPNTYFLRTTFNWSGTASGLILSGRLCVDDGTVIWVNGIEVYRYNVPDGAPTFDQDVGTANPAGEPNIVTFQVSGDGVVADGVNTIAMVNLQANPTGSSDVVMGLDLYGETAIIPSIDDPLLPEDAVVEEGRSHTLSVVASAVPAPTYAWFFGGIEITGATSSDYTITNMTTATAGAYFARVSNSAGSVDSRTATISFAADVTAPVLAGEPTILDDGTVSLPWSEDMDATVFDSFNVSVYPVGGDFFYDNLGIASAILADGTNWVLTTSNPAVPGQAYLLVMYGSSVSDLFGNLNADIFDLPVVNQVAGPVLDNGSILSDGSIELFFNEDMSDVIVAGDISVYPTGGDPVAGNLGVASAVVTDGSTLVLTTTGVAVAGPTTTYRTG